MAKQEIFGLTVKELEARAEKLQLPKFRGKQLADWLYQKHVWDFAGMPNISRKDAALLEEEFTVLPQNVDLLTGKTSENGTTSKLLIRFPDGNSIETVGMQHDYGYSVCVSSQVGCAMNCAFCASTSGGCIRNLTAQEMLAQVALFQKAPNKKSARIGNIIVMGSGEPLLNYSELIKFIHLLHDREIYDIGYRNITVSTCGIVDGIEKLLKENIPVNLAISLHAPDDELRGRLMPVNDKYNISSVVAAADKYAAASGRRITYEYILIKNVNDGINMAKKLAVLLTGRLAAVNIIPFNSIEGKYWEKPGKKDIETFRAMLNGMGVAATVRKEMGADILAACGQLKAAQNPKSFL